MITREFNAIKLYTLYVLTAMLNFWVILFNLGFSAGLANYFPVFALLGTILLFIIASPMLVYKMCMGIIIGFASFFFIFPYSILFTISLFQDWRFSWSLLLVTIPSILVLGCIYITVKYLFTKGYFASIKPINRTAKILLSVIPLLLFILYIIRYGRYWNLSNLFNLHSATVQLTHTLYIKPCEYPDVGIHEFRAEGQVFF